MRNPQRAKAKEPKKKVMVYRLSGPQVMELVEAQGHVPTLAQDKMGDPLVNVKAGSFSYQILFYDCVEGACASLQFRSWWRMQSPLAPGVLNEFNNQNRIGNTYLDHDGDPTLDLSFWMYGGVPMDQVELQFELFLTGAEGFVKFLGEQ